MRAIAQLTAGRDSATDYGAIAADVSTKINLLMWLDRPWDGHEFGEQLEQLKAMRLEWFLLYQNTAILTEVPYYLPWVGFREFGHTFDGLGNSLAIVLGIADEDRTEAILTHAHASGADRPYPLKAFSPSQHPGDRDWREYYRSRNLNLPDQYHNGGIWPFIGGFYVAALVRDGQLDRAGATLGLLADANRLGKEGEWEFNEWLHGVSGRPMGHPLQAWSAGMYVYAHHALKTGEPRSSPNCLPADRDQPAPHQNKGARSIERTPPPCSRAARLRPASGTASRNRQPAARRADGTLRLLQTLLHRGADHDHAGAVDCF